MSFDRAVFCIQNEQLFLKKLYFVNPQSSQNTRNVNIYIFNVSPLQILHCLAMSRRLNINTACFSYAHNCQQDYLEFWLVQRGYLHRQWYWTFSPKLRKIQQQNQIWETKQLIYTHQLMSGEIWWTVILRGRAQRRKAYVQVCY